MGSFLSTPVTDKSITLVHRNAMAHVIGEMQGYRMSMEDAYCDADVMLNVDSVMVPMAIYAVFDGHGGSSASKFLAERFASVVSAQFQHHIDRLDIKLREKLKDPGDRDTVYLMDFQHIMRDIFQLLDSQFYQRPNNNSGSTAVASIIFKDLLITANAGDSRSILSRNGFSKHCSFDHKPRNISELMRIHNNGGFVANNRVNGVLALSRAFGDFGFKMHSSNHHHKLTPPENYQVTVCPDIIIQQLKPLEDEFFVLACDGIWDCLKPQELVSTIRHLVSIGKNLDEIVEIILDRCIGMADTTTGVGFDNMTIIIVALFSEPNSNPNSPTSSTLSLPMRTNTGSTIHSVTSVTRSHTSDKNDGLSNWLSSLKNKVLDEKFGITGH